MPSQWIFYGKTGVEILLLVVALFVVMSWRRCPGKPLLILAVGCRILQPVLWWVWSNKIETGAWPWLGTMSHIVEGISLLLSWGTAAFLLLFALSLKTHLAQRSHPVHELQASPDKAT